MYLARYTKPKLTGVVVKEAVKCGKKNCHCTNGDFHNGYYYLYYRSFEKNAWKLKKEYISRNRVKYLKAKIKEMKNKDMATKVRLSANLNLLKETSGYVRGSMSADDLLKAVYEIT